MSKPFYRELVFDVSEDVGSGYVAECLSESIVTPAETWEELRANVKDVVEAYSFDGPEPQAICLHLVRDEVFQLQ